MVRATPVMGFTPSKVPQRLVLHTITAQVLVDTCTMTHLVTAAHGVACGSLIVINLVLLLQVTWTVMEVALSSGTR